jgi:glutathione S-transferase
MIKLYYARPSAYARPVWLALLEKQLTFELVPVDLAGEQFEPAFLALNPFGHVPVLLDGDFRVFESLAILDYLEARYPERSLLPKDAIALAKVRMVQMITLNKLIPAAITLLSFRRSSSEEAEASKTSELRVLTTTLKFFEELLGDSLYFAGDQLTVAEIFAGTLVYRVPDAGVNLNDYPRLQNWSERLLARPTWQQIQLTDEEWSSFKRHIQVIQRIWQRRRRSSSVN